MSTVNAGHYLLGSLGLALLRTWHGTGDSRARRVEELARFAGDPAAPPMALLIHLPELEAVEGYGRWAATTTPRRIR
jgi:hypothetical protein